jgi:acetyl esterase
VQTYKSANGFNLQAHLFRPDDMKKGEKRPAIVIFHGGGWNGGNPSWAFNRARHFKDLGMVAVAAQYRLTNRKDITAIECMADARDLIKWMRSNSDSLNILPDKIAAYGWSAGAHLASSAAIFSDSIPGQGINSVPNALILVSPAVSLPGNTGWKYSVLGPSVSVGSVNPVEHVRKGLPPTLILEGRDDTVTPLDGVQSFHDKMLENGNYCELWIYDGVGHLFTPKSMPDDGDPHPDMEIEKEAFTKADQFLRKFGYVREKSEVMVQ